jgi:hypothetical protein
MSERQRANHEITGRTSARDEPDAAMSERSERIMTSQGGHPRDTSRMPA